MIKRKLNFNYFLIISLTLHLSIACGLGGWLIPYKKNFNLGKEREEVILLEIGWIEKEPELPSVAKQTDLIKSSLELPQTKGWKKIAKQDSKSFRKSSPSLSPKIGRSGEDRINLLSGNNSYLEEVRRRIEKAKFYPPQAKMARLEGEVTLEFQIDKWGKVENIRLTQPSKYKIFNTAAQKILAKASPFPKPGDESIIDKTIETTLVFELTY